MGFRFYGCNRESKIEGRRRADPKHEQQGQAHFRFSAQEVARKIENLKSKIEDSMGTAAGALRQDVRGGIHHFHTGRRVTQGGLQVPPAGSSEASSHTSA